MNMNAAIVHAQLIKTVRTRGVVLLLAVVAASTALATLAPALVVGRKGTSHTTIEAAITLGVAVAYLLGVGMSAGDLQHGMTRTLLLIEPRRNYYLSACLVSTAIVGAALGSLAAGTVIASRPLVGVGTPLQEGFLTVLGGAAAGAGYAVMGLAVGVLVANQIGAASIGLLYTLVAEPLISQQSYGIYLKLPGGAREALVRHASVTQHIPTQPVGLLTLCIWAAVLFVVAAVVYQRRDIP